MAVERSDRLDLGGRGVVRGDVLGLLEPKINKIHDNKNIVIEIEKKSGLRAARGEALE